MRTHIQPTNDDQRAWNAIFVVIYIILVTAAIWALKEKTALPYAISTFDFVIVSLATFRLTRLVVYDEIFFFFRSWFLDKDVAHGEDEAESTGVITMREPERGVRKTLTHLVSCPWCAGVWLALAATFVYFFFAWGWFVLTVLAIAGVATLLQLVANAIGWTAELLKEKAGGGE